MVFSSVPLYLDPPNWQQTHQHPNNETPNPHQLQLPPQLGGGGSQPPQIKPPGSTSERARMAKIPAPDGPLRCPRPGCESTNTKFCYYNNYNLSQPRHFCKACRRYWTRGGALRNVPVGGACRRNKRRKKSPGPKLAEPHRHQAPPPDHHLHRMLPPVGPAPSSAPPYSFMASLQGMTSLGMGMTSYGGNNNNNNSNIINYSQLGYGVAAQQLSLFAGPSSSSVASMYPFQMSEGGEETASYRGGAGQFWGAHINNNNNNNNNNNSSPAAGSSGGGLWTDLSGSHMQ